MNYEVNLDTDMNEIYKPLLVNKSRYLVLKGGAGSGKSHFIAQKIMYRICKSLKNRTRHGFLALRKTGPACRASVFALLKHYFYKWGLNNYGKVRETDMTFTFVNDSFIKCSGLDDPEKVKSIEGVTDIWIEEATEFQEIDFTQLDLRVRGETDSYKQIALSFNPVDWNSFLKEKFFDNTCPDATVLTTTYKHNKFIDGNYIKVLLGLKDQDVTLWSIYGEGEWAILKGLIYSNYDFVVDWPVNFDDTIYGLDFGFHSPTALVEIGIKDTELWIRERIYESQMTNTMFIDKMNAIGIKQNVFIFGDISEPDRLKEIENAGFLVGDSRKGKHSVFDGIETIKSHKLHIHADSTNIKKELQSYKWKEDKNGDPITPEEPVKFNDHGLDSIRYAVFSYFDNTPVPKVLGWS